MLLLDVMEKIGYIAIAVVSASFSGSDFRNGRLCSTNPPSNLCLSSHGWLTDSLFAIIGSCSLASFYLYFTFPIPSFSMPLLDLCWCFYHKTFPSENNALRKELVRSSMCNNSPKYLGNPLLARFAGHVMLLTYYFIVNSYHAPMHNYPSRYRGSSLARYDMVEATEAPSYSVAMLVVADSIFFLGFLSFVWVVESSNIWLEKVDQLSKRHLHEWCDTLTLVVRGNMGNVLKENCIATTVIDEPRSFGLSFIIASLACFPTPLSAYLPLDTFHLRWIVDHWGRRHS